MNNKGQAGFAVAGALVVVIFISTLFIMLLGFDTVDASHIGVMNQFGELKGVMLPGMKWTGIFTHVEQYDLRMRQSTVEMLTGEQVAVDKDGQSVKSRILINYRLIPENVQDAYARVGVDRDLATILNLDGIIREGFKTATAKYTSTEIWQNRDKIKEEAITIIEDNFPKQYFVLENVIIPDIDFNPAFMAAIEAQKTNEKLALAKEKEVDIAKFEADRKVAEQKGISESAKIQYDADAYKILKAAESEAESLRLKKEQISDQLIQLEWINAWKSGGAQVPQWMMSNGGSNSQFLMQIPMDKIGG